MFSSRVRLFLLISMLIKEAFILVLLLRVWGILNLLQGLIGGN